MRAEEPSKFFSAALRRAVLLPLAAMALLAVLLGLQIRELRTTAWWVDHTDRVISQARLVRRLIYDGATNQRGFLVSGVDGYRAASETALAQAAREQATLTRMVGDNSSQVRRAQEITVLTDRWRALIAAETSAKAQGHDFRARFADGMSQRALDGVTSAFDRFLAVEDELRSQRQDVETATGRVTGALLLTLSILVAGALVGYTRKEMRQLARTYERSIAEVTASEQRFSTTLTSIGDGVIATDVAGNVNFLNRVAERLTGWSIGDAHGHSASEVFRIINADTRSALEDPVSRVLRDRVVVGLANHTLLVSRDGTEYPIEDSGAPILNRAGAITGAVLVFRDVTDQYAQERRTREAEQSRGETLALLDTLMSTAPVGLGFLDTEMRFRRVNYALAETNGLSIEEHIGRTPEEITPELGPRLSALYRRVLASGEPVLNMEVRGKTPAIPGQDRTWLMNYYPVRGHDGRTTGVGIVVIEITERKRQEAQILALNARLRGMIEETHHRVRNNLQIIAAMVEMQQTEHEGTTIPTTELQRLSAHVRTLGIVHDLLMEDAREGGQANVVSTKDLLLRMAPMFEQRAPRCTFTVEVEDAPLATRRATSLGLILIELVTNSMSFGNCQIGIRFHVEGDDGVLEVTDDGPGLPEEFDPVRHAHTGLTFVEHLARWDLGALVSFMNGTSGGAHVRLTIPLNAPTEVRPAL